MKKFLKNNWLLVIVALVVGSAIIVVTPTVFENIETKSTDSVVITVADSIKNNIVDSTKVDSLVVDSVK